MCLPFQWKPATYDSPSSMFGLGSSWRFLLKGSQLFCHKLILGHVLCQCFACWSITQGCQGVWPNGHQLLVESQLLVSSWSWVYYLSGPWTHWWWILNSFPYVVLWPVDWRTQSTHHQPSRPSPSYHLPCSWCHHPLWWWKGVSLHMMADPAGNLLPIISSTKPVSCSTKHWSAMVLPMSMINKNSKHRI